MSNFKTTVEQHAKQLELYVPIVARVHGAAHPEFLEVKRVYDALVQDYKDLQEDKLAVHFSELKEITNDYTIPSDVCESYEAVYDMLKEIDRAYSK